MKHFFTQLICLPQQHFVIKILVFIHPNEVFFWPQG